MDLPAARPRLWGMDPFELHDRYWASLGIQVVRLGRPTKIVDGASLFLLADNVMLSIFSVDEIIERFYWCNPAVMFLRIRESRTVAYRERIITRGEDEFVRFERSYRDRTLHDARMVLTRDSMIARQWHGVDCAATARRAMRNQLSRRWIVGCASGAVYDERSDHEVSRFIRHLVGAWSRPDLTIPQLRQVRRGIWAGRDVTIHPEARFVGPVWIGAGREVPSNAILSGPTVLWDSRRYAEAVPEVDWAQLEPATPRLSLKPYFRTTSGRAAKRLFDIAFATFMLLITGLLYPFIMLAIWLEDGRPFFFGHQREGLDGKEFTCWKFRSMRRDAEQMKRTLASENQADGPQFFIRNDPRLTRVGRLIRRCNLDELPQFWNVLIGDMAVVGPRPSPYQENQCCPAWREARLKVRPGITGLWQVNRTRQIGADFQEWIRFDMEYVRKANWWSDISIILRTPFVMFDKRV